MNEQQFAVALENFKTGLVGQFCWAEFRDNMKAVALDEEKMERWFDWLANLMANDMVFEGEAPFKPQDFEYKITVENQVQEETVRLRVQLMPASDRAKELIGKSALKAAYFVWPVQVHGDDVLTIEAFTYYKEFDVEPSKAGLVTEVAGYADKPKSEPIADPVPEITKRLQPRPIFGWLKEALEKGVVSYEGLKELLQQPLFYHLAHREETYVSFFRKLDKFLEQEFPVMDKNRALFRLRFSSGTQMHELLTISYHSQRHDADVKRNTLNVLCPLSWGNDADWPVIVDPEVSFQPIHYTGTLVDHAVTEVRFHLQRTMNRVSFNTPITDQLQTYFNDAQLTSIVDRRLVEANIHHLVSHVIVSMDQTPSVMDVQFTSLTAHAHFYQKADLREKVVAPFATLELTLEYEAGAFVWSHDVPEIIILPTQLMETLKHPEAPAATFDLKDKVGFQTLSDPVTYSKPVVEAPVAHNPMHESHPLQPVKSSRDFDLKFELEFTDPTVANPIFFTFEAILPGITVKYQELCAVLGQRAGLTGVENVKLNVEGHVDDQARSGAYKTYVEITLTHEETLNGNAIRTQVGFAFSA